MQHVGKFTRIAILVLAVSYVTACNPKREYFATEYTTTSPNNINYLYKITTQGTGGWGPHVRYLYLSSDFGGISAIPEPNIRLGEVGVGCLKTVWLSDYEAKIQYCTTKGSLMGTKKYQLNNETITLHFERAPNCKPTTNSSYDSLKQCQVSAVSD